MDEKRFDELTRGLTDGSTRRRVLGGLAAGLAGIGALLGRDEAEAKRGKKKRKRKCQGANRRKCGGRCVNINNSEEHCGRCNNPCGSGEVCRARSCVPST